MNTKRFLVILGGLLLSLSAAPAMANDAEDTAGQPPRPTEAQMQAIHDCVTAKGIEMPAPPAKGEKPASGKEAGKPPAPPKLTDAQKAAMDACFKEAGVEPPKGPPHGGKGGEPKGPPPADNKGE